MRDTMEQDGKFKVMYAYRQYCKGFFSQCDWGLLLPLHSQNKGIMNYMYNLHPMTYNTVAFGNHFCFSTTMGIILECLSKTISRYYTKYIELTSETQLVFHSQLCEISQKWFQKNFMIYFLQTMFVCMCTVFSVPQFWGYKWPLLHPVYYLGSGDLNSVPHAYTKMLLPTDQSVGST